MPLIEWMIMFDRGFVKVAVLDEVAQATSEWSINYLDHEHSSFWLKLTIQLDCLKIKGNVS